MEGRIHSTESFGTVDGPGTRFVIFLQGCPMRCAYCHNPDTWEVNGGTLRTAESLMEEFEKLRPFYKNGGITVTGGEPLLQVDFLIELFSLCKAEGVHTCIDSSGITYNPHNTAYMEKLDKLMTLTDLVMLDIKQTDPVEHEKLCKQPNAPILAFAKYLSDKQIPIWVRRVVVPGLTDDPAELKQLGEFLATLHNIKALDVLPYHNMGIPKYEKLGIPYPLKDVKPMTQEGAVKCRDIIMEAWKAKKHELMGENQGTN